MKVAVYMAFQRNAVIVDIEASDGDVETATYHCATYGDMKKRAIQLRNYYATQPYVSDATLTYMVG